MKIPQRKDRVQPIIASGNAKGNVGAAGMEYGALEGVGRSINQGADVMADTGLAIQRIDNWKKESDAEIADLKGFNEYWNTIQSSPNYLKMATTLDKNGKSELETDYENFAKTHHQNVLSNVTNPQSKMRIEQMLAQNHIGRLAKVVRPTSREMIVKDEISKIPGKLDVFVRAGKPEEASAYLEGLAQRGVLDPIQKEQFEQDIDKILKTQGVESEIAAARGIYDETRDKMQAVKYIRNSKLIPESDKEPYIQDVMAEAKIFEYETSVQEQNKILKLLDSKQTTDWWHAEEIALTSKTMDPTEKKLWIDRVQAHRKAAADGTNSPFAKTDPGIEVELWNRIRTKPNEIDDNEILGYAGKGISTDTAKSLITFWEEKKAGKYTPQQTRALEMIDRLRANQISFVKDDPKAVLDIENNMMALSNNYIEWVRQNPQATDDQLEAKLKSMTRPVEDDVALNFLERLYYRKEGAILDIGNPFAKSAEQALIDKKVNRLKDIGEWDKMSKEEQDSATLAFKQGKSVEFIMGLLNAQ